MQTTIVDVTEEIKVIVEHRDLMSTHNIYYQGPYGRETIGADMGEISLEETIAGAARLSRYTSTMNTLRGNHLLSRLFHTLVKEQGLDQTAHQLAELGLLIRARHNGRTGQAFAGSLPYPYDRISDPIADLSYSVAGNWCYFKLSQAGDEIAFCTRTSEGSRWSVNDSISRGIKDFAVKRLFEIYRSDPSKTHLAWVTDLQLSGDLGL
jgi:hypothetical protein